MKSNSLVALLITCLSFLSFTADGYYYKKYTTSNSLVDNNVYHCVRDRKGYMWFFTDKGVSKFDGVKFTNFSVANGLNESAVYSGYQDKTGRMWLFTGKGHPCFIRHDSVFNEKNNTLLKKMPIIAFIEHIYEDADSSLYIGYQDGSVYKLHDTICSPIIKGSFADKVLFICKEKNTIRIYGEHTITALGNDRIITSMQSEKVIGFHDFEEKLIADREGIKMYRNDQLIWDYKDSLVGISHEIIHLYYDGQENIFCATSNGLVIINTKTNKKNKLFGEEHISSTAQDIYGNFWVTTGSGIYYLNKNLDKIKSLAQVSDFRVTETYNHQIFFSKDSVIYWYKESDTSVLEKINIHINDGSTIPGFSNDRYFFYNYNNNVGYCLDRKNNKILPIPNFKNIFQLNDSQYVISRWADFMIATFHDYVSISRPVFIVTSGNGIVSNHVLYFYDGVKVFSYDIPTGRSEAIDVLAPDQSVVNSYFWNGIFIVITNNQNIITYDTKNGNRKQLFKDLPFFCFGIGIMNPVRGPQKYILNTDDGYYTADNLNNITGSKRIEYPINQSDLLNLYAAGSNIICNLNGSVYFFSDSLINKETQHPVFYIESVSVDGKSKNDSVIVIKNSLRTHVAVALSSPKFNSAGSHYAYRIVTGSNTSTWYNSTSDKLDILLDKYDEYQIEVRAITDGGTASESRYINVTVLPPFYLSYPFFAFVIVLLIFTIILSVRAYHKHRLKLFQNELSYLQLEHKAINSLLNPHFIFNAINNIQGLINTNSKDTANNYLAILSKLIRQNIDNLQFSFIPVSKELSLIKNYIHLQNLRFDNRIELKVNNSVDNLEEINIPPLLIHTFVENSVVHGFRKDMDNFTIRVELSLSTDDYLIIRITDNGTGLSEQKANDPIADKLSLGIDFIKKRLKRISDFYKVSYSLEIKNVPGDELTGTEVVIVLYSKFKNEN